MICCDTVIGKADKSWSSLLLRATSVRQTHKIDKRGADGFSQVVDNDQVFVNNPDAINARYVILYTLT